MRNILIRSASGAVFILAVLGSLWLGYYYAALLFSLIAAFGTAEFYKLSNNLGKPFKTGGMVMSFIALNTIAHLFVSPNQYWLISVIILMPVIISAAVLYRKSNTSISDISLTVFGSVYVVVPFLSLLVLSLLPDFYLSNYNWLIPTSVFILIWINDTGAFLAGSAFGKHKLFERISPKKTWEGSIGGALASLAGAAVLYYFFGLYELWVWIGLALLLSISSSLGDLFESLLKRQAEVKDSGKVMPGHGGILDRFDAMLFAAPVALAYLLLVAD